MKGILGLFKRNQKVENQEVVKEEIKLEIFKGKWDLGGKELIGAYIRRGSDKLFVTNNGIIVLPKMKKRELVRAIETEGIWNVGGVFVDSYKIEKYIYDVLNCNAVPFIRISEA